MGNVINFMNLVVIVEYFDNMCYMVVLMSNVFRKNFVLDYLVLVNGIDKIIRK